VNPGRACGRRNWTGPGKRRILNEDIFRNGNREKDDHDMTKAKARARAKAKAPDKAKKRAANAGKPGPKIRPGQFDPEASSIKGPGVNVSAKSHAATKRGSARSK